MSNLTPELSLKRLIEGNERFAAEKPGRKEIGESRRKNLLDGQEPFAAIIGCSDSRTPPEILFDQGLGDLFIVRTAGNTVDAIGVGSIEYAVEHLGVPLVVALGHDKCGAVKEACNAVIQKTKEFPGSIGALVEKLRPSVEKVIASGVSGEELVEAVADENIRAVVQDVLKSPIVKHLAESKKLEVRGAKYDLASGKVRFLG